MSFKEGVTMEKEPKYRPLSLQVRSHGVIRGQLSPKLCWTQNMYLLNI